MTSPIQCCIHWLASPKIRNVGLVFDVLEMNEAVHQNLFLKLIFIHSLKNDNLDPLWSDKLYINLYWNSASEFFLVQSTHMKLLGFTRIQRIKLYDR